MTFKILMTCAGGEMSPQLYSMLKNSQRYEIEIIGVDMDSQAIGRHFCDHFFVVPSADASNYINVIDNICRQFNINLILPGSDEEVFALSPFRQQLETPERYLACAPAAVLEKIKDKVTSYKALENLGIAIPKWQGVSSLEDLPEIAKEMHELYGDIVIKPSGGRGGRDVYIIREDIPNGEVRKLERQSHLNYATFLERLQSLPFLNLPLIVCERLQDPVYDIDLLGWQGKTISMVPRCRANSANPNQGNRIVNRPELIKLGRQLIESLSISSILDCDVMYNQKGEPCVIEINPRPSGSLSFSMAAGFPMIENLIALVLGEQPNIMPPLQEKNIHSYSALFVE